MRAKDPGSLDVHRVSAELQSHGWIVPAYKLPANAEHIDVLRMVVRESFGRDMAELLLGDLRTAVDHLASAPGAGAAKPDRPLPHRPHC